jgi:hypothetical protein
MTTYTYVTGDGKKHKTLAAALQHAGMIQKKTGNIIAIERK